MPRPRTLLISSTPGEALGFQELQLSSRQHRRVWLVPVHHLSHVPPCMQALAVRMRSGQGFLG